MSQEWLQRYNARKQGAAAPPPQYVPQPQYAPQPPPPQYYPPQPPQLAYGPQPVPGAPPHAPFGYDPATGVPVAPYGHSQQGHILVQPPWGPPPPQQPQQPGWQPNGLPAPQGYGQAPYGAVQPYPEAPPPQNDGQPQNFHDRVRYAISHVTGAQGSREVGQCEQCGGMLIPTDAKGGEGGVFNATLGRTVFAAAHCAQCGSIAKDSGSFRPGESTGAMVDGMGVRVEGAPHLAPGARTQEQAAHFHGLPNLFAPQ